jgi:hypothetical protein
MALNSKSKIKVWKCSRESEAGFMVTPEAAVMAGASGAFIAADKHGVHISGPLSIITSGDQVRRGGLFIEFNEFIAMIPSTIVTPIPKVMICPPIAMFASIAKTMPFVLAATLVAAL